MLSPRATAARVLLVVAVLFGIVGVDPAGSQNTALDITEAGIQEHLDAFQDIADANGGNRAVGTPGYEASVDYVASRLDAAGYEVEVQDFEIGDSPVKDTDPVFERTAPGTETYTEGVDYIEPSPGAAIDTSGDIFVVADGCNPDSFLAMPAGAVALVELSGDCEPIYPFAYGFNQGAVAVLLSAENGPGAPPEQIDLAIYPFELRTMALSISGDTGAALQTLASGDTVTVSLESGWKTGFVESKNVIANWPGTGDEVVTMGSHLDSVYAGPGINDNGSGSAGILEVAESLAEVAPTTQRTIRFGWWGAEEIGLLGSTAYVESLPPAELARIEAYLNADMIGSPNWFRGVADPDVATDPETVAPGSEPITELFLAHFESLGLPTAPFWYDGRSDDAAFAKAGVPTGGVFTGAEMEKTPELAALFGGEAGVSFDPCYHQACDDIDNVNVELAAQNANAMGAVALQLSGVVGETARGVTTEPARPAVAVDRAPAFTG